MLQITQIKLPVEHTESDLKKKIEKELDLIRIFKTIPRYCYKITRKSIDARKKPEIFYVYSVVVTFIDCPSWDSLMISELFMVDEINDNEQLVLKRCKSKNVSNYNSNKYIAREAGNSNELKHISTIKGYSAPVIVGEGPCGLFAGYILAKAGLNPIIIERGDKVEKRVDKVENFWLTGSIDENSNVQFGEGGAGAFSDGKLNTLVKDKTGKNQFVLDTFVRFGADKAISYDAKPHIGTDVLRDVVKHMREDIINLGGSVLHNHLLTDLDIENGQLKALIVDNLNDGTKERIETKYCVLAVGHSARDFFEKIDSIINIEQKNFAVGIRIQHPQSMIDDSQYGKGHSESLPPSPYKVTNHTSNGRDVFSFCMCPGGYVVNASSVKGYTCVNGMSYSDRSSENANSALIVAVDRNDFGNDDTLAGMRLQERMEKCAYSLGNGKIPVQLFKDFKKSIKSSAFGIVKPVFKGGIEFANLRDIFPEEINTAIIESIEKFGYTIEGFDDDDAILAAVESRTSSPIRINRDEYFESNIKGIYPAGEGAGYAGGIMSAAMDGIRVADAIIDKIVRNQ